MKSGKNSASFKYALTPAQRSKAQRNAHTRMFEVKLLLITVP